MFPDNTGMMTGALTGMPSSQQLNTAQQPYPTGWDPYNTPMMSQNNMMNGLFSLSPDQLKALSQGMGQLPISGIQGVYGGM